MRGSGESYFVLPSHPTRVRGLKRRTRTRRLIAVTIAPHAGARIETILTMMKLLRLCIAPLVGARIETTAGRIFSTILASHPTLVRGLNKPCMGGGSMDLKKTFFMKVFFLFQPSKNFLKKLKNLLQNKQSYVILHNVIGWTPLIASFQKQQTAI